MAFLKRGYGWVVLIGLGLVLLAAAAWINHGKPAEAAAVPPRVLVEQAVSNLQPCLTCHSTTASQTELIAYQTTRRHPSEVLSENEQSIPVAADLQARLDSQLIETGQRILELPETGTPAYQTILSDYLQIYDSSRLNTDQKVLVVALDRLSQLEQLIKVLEHQASPYQWKTTSPSQAVQINMAVLSSVSPPTYAALYHSPLLWDRVPAEGRSTPDLVVFTPVKLVFDAYRRGPPATDSLATFVWNTRLPSYDAQSRFSFVDNAHITTI